MVEVGSDVFVGPGVFVFGIAAIVWAARVSGGTTSTAGAQPARSNRMSRRDSHFMIISP